MGPQAFALEVRQDYIPLHRLLGNQHHGSKCSHPYPAQDGRTAERQCPHLVEVPSAPLGLPLPEQWCGRSPKALGPPRCAVYALQVSQGCAEGASQIRERWYVSTVMQALCRTLLSLLHRCGQATLT